ncbi:MAG: VWA domain-containing protein [Treponema sp.]|nr:VWA domain-containing protein [Treponema sp.]
MSLGFDRPLFLLAGFILIPLFILVIRYFKPLFALTIPLGPPGGIAFKSPVNLRYLMRILTALELLGAFLLFVVVSGPHLVYTDIVWLNRGADILFVLDVSPSMAALDMNGRSRFDTARSLLLDFADSRGQDAIGVIAVGQDAALILPVTTDRESLRSRMSSLMIGELGDGTALGTGLGLAALHMNRSQAPRRAVVMITDGENNAGSIHPEAAAAALGEMGVTLWVIGVGSGGEVPFSYTDPLTQIHRTGFFDSRYDPAALSVIAERAGGHWIHAPGPEGFIDAFARINQGEVVVRRSGSIRREEPLYIPFILTSIALIWGVRFVKRHILGALL